MKTKNLSLEDFQEKKISNNGLKSIFGGETSIPPFIGGGNGVTGGSGHQNTNSPSSSPLLPELIDPV